MKQRHAFVTSLILHTALIAAIVLFELPEEKEEEVTLELSLSSVCTEPEPTPPTPQPPKPQTSKPEPKHEPIKPIEKRAEAPMPTPKPLIAEPKSEPPVPLVKSEPTPPTPQPPKPQLAPAPVEVNEEQVYLDDHLAAIRDLLIKYHKYPTKAVRLKQQGSVQVSFRLKKNGEVEDIKITDSSGFDILDEGAIDLVRKTAIYFPKPPKTVRITVPIGYKLV